MTPAARLSAAIEILDRILAGGAAEQALTSWARSNRFAGSGDRLVIRDHVFDALRCKRSFAHIGGSETGRGLVLGMLRTTGSEIGALLTGQGHAPAPLTQAEETYHPAPMPDPVRLDCPDWLWPMMLDSLGAETAPILSRMQSRAPVFVRVNLRHKQAMQAVEILRREGIMAQPHPLAPTALEVTEGARKLRQSRAFADGLVELQDAASQAVIAVLPDLQGLRVLDYCAGGGGKALALAARGAQVTAYDADPARMQDTGPRAARAGVRIALTDRPEGQFDLVLADVPCSGSGSWRRAPQGKWLLDADGLARLLSIQSEILDRAACLVRPQGWLAYVTCSLLQCENDHQITGFLARNAAFQLVQRLRLTPLDGGDGFFLSLIKRNE
ncbi:MAG: RsmB/NOP family class I SAM-dependent RNA methyltransferase [Roseinatronobacter sp.]